MRFTICSVGKLKEKYWRDAVEEYTKRLSRYGKISLIEVPDEKAPESMSKQQEKIVLEKEGERLLKAIPSDAFVIILDIRGKMLSSEELAQFISNQEVNGTSHVAFVIGGSLGLSALIKKQAGFSLSFSPMTFPHQMMRVVLLEQIYRAIKIQKNEPYHK